MTSFKYYLPAFLWAALLFYLSSLTMVEMPELAVKFSDLFLHFAAYSVLGYFLGIAAFAPDLQISNKKICVTIGIGLLYGASDEIHQMFVAGRQATVSDWVADSFGVMFGLMIFVKIQTIFKFIDRLVFRTVS